MNGFSAKKLFENNHAALRKLRLRLKGMTRSLAVGLVAVLALLAAGKLNFAYAVDLGGDVIGYVSSLQELDAIVENVQQSVSGALGCDWNAPELTTRVTLGGSSAMAEESGVIVANRLLGSVADVAELSLVYVNGSAVCAFRSSAEAADAVMTLREKYVHDDDETAAFLETVAIGSGVADRKLLENNEEALAAALTVETVSSITVETAIPCEIEFRMDDTLFSDEHYVIAEGCDGVEITEYRVVKHNGHTTDYTAVCSNRYAPVTRVITVGTRTRLSSGNYIWPVEEAVISSDFGFRTSIGSSNHQGIDLANDEGTPIYAADGGEVIFADTYQGFGEIIQIRHDNGDVTYYAHCSRMLVSAGEIVEQGQKIALMGATGVATGNHLHFEVHPGGGDAVNPIDCLPFCPFEHMDE